MQLDVGIRDRTRVTAGRARRDQRKASAYSRAWQRRLVALRQEARFHDTVWWRCELRQTNLFRRYNEAQGRLSRIYLSSAWAGSSPTGGERK